MNKIIYLSILVAFGLSATAQPGKTHNVNQIYPGHIITLTNDTAQGFIQYGSREANQSKCIFYTNADDSKTKKIYKPSELKGYAVEDQHFRSLDYSGNIGFLGKGDRSFLLISEPGRINTYVYYLDNEQIVWQKGDEPAVSNASMLMGFKKNVLKLVGDYPELVAKIEKKEKGYGMLNIAAIITEYNTWYDSKK